jgi:hypothetical protein
VRIPPASTAFTLLLSFLVVLPSPSTYRKGRNRVLSPDQQASQFLRRKERGAR